MFSGETSGQSSSRTLLLRSHADELRADNSWMVPLLFSLEDAASGSDPSDPRTVSLSASVHFNELWSRGDGRVSGSWSHVASSLPGGALTCICGCYGETMIPGRDPELRLGFPGQNQVCL